MTALLCFSAFCFGVVVATCVIAAILLGIIGAPQEDPCLTRPLDCFTNPDLFRAPASQGDA